MPTRHLLIKGKVQGVFYRASAKEMADKAGVTGWIKNTAEGDVEAMVSGSEEQIQYFSHWCKQGPKRANVTEVITSEQIETVFDGFTVLR